MRDDRSDPGRHPSGSQEGMGADELLLIEVLQDWAGREHPDDPDVSGLAVESAIEALAGGASLFEALHVGRSAADRCGT